MSKMKKKKSRFAGFLNGYKASNIASIEPAIKFHEEQIYEKLSSLKNMVAEQTNNTELLSMLNRLQSIMAKEDRDFLESALVFGEAFYSYLNMHNEMFNQTDIEINEKVKYIIRDYISLAEKSEDTNLLSLAIKVGENFRLL
jgi:hypothetical protein